jgi:hypothetical protein
MSWKDILFQSFVGLLEILATIGKAIGTLLVTVIKIWEPICFAVLGYFLGDLLAKLINLPPDMKIQLKFYIAFLGLVFGVAIATRRLKKNRRE